MTTQPVRITMPCVLTDDAVALVLDKGIEIDGKKINVNYVRRPTSTSMTQRLTHWHYTSIEGEVDL